MISFIAVIALFAPGLRSSSLHVSPESMKLAWSVAGICILFFLWLLSNNRDNQKIQKSSFYFPIVGFIVWCAISFFWVVDSYLATVQFVQFISVALAFFIILNSVRSEDEVEQLLSLVVLASLMVSLVGWLQFIFPNNEFITSLFRVNTDAASTFGNKNMASHFMVMALPISIVLFLKSTDIKKIVFFLLVSIISCGFLVITYTRTGILALMVEMFLLASFLVYERFKYKNSFSKIYKILLYSFLVIIAVFFYVNSQYNNESSLLSKVTTRFELAKNQALTVESEAKHLNNPRVAPWKNTFELIKDNPLVGVGVGQWPTYYPLYYDRIEKDVFFNEKVQFRHLHNDYLEVLANVGIIGVFFLLWLFLLIMRSTYQVLSDSEREGRYLVLALILGLIGFAVSAVFSFPLKVHYPLLLAMVYIALIAGIYDRNINLQANSSIGENNEIRPSIDYYVLSKRQTKSLLLFSIVLAVVASGVSYKWLMGEHYFRLTEGVELAKYDDPIEKSLIKLQTIEKSIVANPYNSSSQFLAGQVLIENNDMDGGIKYLEKSLRSSPYQALTLRSLFLVYATKNDLNNMLRLVEKYMEIDPRSVRAYAYATSVYLRLERIDDAKIVYQQMKENYSYFKDRVGFGPYYSEVTHAAGAIGDAKYIKEILFEAIDKDPGNAVYLKKLGGLLYTYPRTKNDSKKGIEFLKQALKLDPTISDHKKIKLIINGFEKNAAGVF